ncbi:hypothetical protein AAFM71_01910 [Chromobacterium violaceum]|uniref:hypothetical protein n=1 Tax=Chromobacterium violaceum TaxID=536 RepID=UPI0015FD2895|nr:hypothetical protein [Chromobacterium violaceum]MBA8736073.1 hypothetical protein [Chromobacterium violaceum]MBT2867979.1 hypothetical protein [Chromobacterium violaceum]
MLSKIIEKKIRKNIYYKINNFSFIESQFKFPGFWSEGKCYLKAASNNGNIFFLCIQLKNYSGTSITNGIESIFTNAADYLLAKNYIEFKTNRDWLLDLTSQSLTFNKIYKKIKNELLTEAINKHSIWIEHYPPGVGLAEDGSFAYVRFDAKLNPDWTYLSQEAIYKKLGAPVNFLEFNEKDLQIHEQE